MSKDGKVGYKKPPKSGQFKKGQSGNPNGRPRQKKVSLEGIIGEFLNEEVTGNVNGEDLVMTNAEALLRRLRDYGLQGNLKAIKKLIDLQKRSKKVTKILRIVEVDDVDEAMRIQNELGFEEEGDDDDERGS